MIVKTNLFTKNLGLLYKMKKCSVVENMAFFYTEGKNLFAEIPSKTFMSLRVIMATGVEGECEFSVDVNKLVAALKGTTAEEFDLEVRPNNINILAEDKITMSIFGGKGSMAKLPRFSEMQVIGTGVLSKETVWGVVTNYIDSVHELDQTFSYVHIADHVVSTDSKVLRKSVGGLDIPYPVIINSDAYSIISEMMKESKDSVMLNFYQNRVEAISPSITLIMMNNANILSAYKDNVLSIPTQTDIDTTFTINKNEIQSFFDRYSGLMKKGNYHCTIDFAGKKLMFDNGEDTIERDITLSVKGEFSNKKINLVRLIQSLQHCGESVEIQSSVAPDGYLYFKNEVEQIILTVVVD